MKSFIAALVGLLAVANAHMEISKPAPFRSRYNPFTTDIDYSMTNPLSSSGSDFPCKGYHKLLDTPQGGSTATWVRGSRQTMTIVGSVTHNGGSCQASLSYDRGATFKAIHTWIGNCPLRSDWQFTVPSDAPTGSALFAWSWWNNLGNREMYMNCAHITIASGREAEAEEAETDVEIEARDDVQAANWSSRPPMFVANVNNGCSTAETYDVLIPNPGPDVSYESSKTAPPIGNCGARKVKALKA
jgi:hypothetical protein